MILETHDDTQTIWPTEIGFLDELSCLMTTVRTSGAQER